MRGLPLYAIPVGKLLLVPVASWFIVSRVLERPLPTTLTLDPVNLAAAILVNEAALASFAFRMRTVLGLFGLRLPVGQAFRIHLQSMFYFFVLPMTIGLEAARFAKVRHAVGAEAAPVRLVSALLADRLMGALAAAIFAASLLPGMPLVLPPAWRPSAPVLAGTAGIALLLSLVLYPAARRLLRIPTGLVGRQGVFPALAASLCTHAVFALGIHLAASATGLSLSFPETLFVISVAMFAVVVPVSFAGVSPVEAAIVGIALGLGMPVEEAFLFAFISYAAKLLAALQGGGWELYEGGQYVSRRIYGTPDEGA